MKADIPVNTIIEGGCLEVMSKWPAESIHCCVTSPPYLGLRDYGVDGQLGLEKTPEEYVAKMVAVFAEVKRVLRSDGTFWLNLGDSYAGSSNDRPRPDHSGTTILKTRGKQTYSAAAVAPVFPVPHNLKQKDLCGIPWRVAFALQADGWYLRQDIIWAKPNPMPESVTDRCTKAHEYLFLLTKKPRYFYDADAIREEHSASSQSRMKYPVLAKGGKCEKAQGDTYIASQLSSLTRKNGTPKMQYNPAGRNRRSVWKVENKSDVWEVTTKAFPDAHFATFPPKLIEPCILAGTSEKGCCPECGGPWERVVEKSPGMERDRTAVEGLPDGMRGHGIRKLSGKAHRDHKATYPDKTTGWRTTCKCDFSNLGYGNAGNLNPPPTEPYPSVPCIVLDPFMGSGTVAEVAAKLKRDYVGVELKPEYADMARKRLEAVETGVPQKEAEKGQMAMFSEARP